MIIRFADSTRADSEVELAASAGCIGRLYGRAENAHDDALSVPRFEVPDITEQASDAMDGADEPASSTWLAAGECSNDDDKQRVASCE
jgi:hypothetical protein